MDNEYLIVFVATFVFFALTNLYIAGKAYGKRGPFASRLGRAALLAMLINISYVASILAGTYRRASVFSSIYFISIDWMLITLVRFVMLFTETDEKKYYGPIRAGIRVYAIFDTAVLFLNIFREIAVSYDNAGRVYAGYTYQMKPLYYAHLLFTYFIVVLILYILFNKILSTPQAYRNQFFYIVLAIVVVVIVNAMFLFVDGSSPVAELDVSILGYSLGLVILYWAAFDYRERYMLESLSMSIFANLDQGIVLFDYSGKLIMHNQAAEKMLANVRFRDRLDMEVFLRDSELSAERRTGDAYTIQHPQIPSLRCDFRCMRDSSDAVISNLFVFTNIAHDTDPLTGFVLWEKFRQFAVENPGNFDPPTAVVMFDIIGLDLVNRTFGREIGDQRVRNLVKIMKKHFPQETYFVRGYEAHLIAICYHTAEKDVYAIAERIAGESVETVQFGMSQTELSPEGSSRNILAAVETAARSLQVKKMLDHTSMHSHSLTSLVRALQESDSDTEAHVRRTQKMGDILGRRIGLSDAELSDLKLLCLLHDIGKIGIPLEILNKPGKLTEAEWTSLRSHVEKGYQIAMSSDELKGIAGMILHHHESWDGRGYPAGLSGADIPLLSRIISIVDAYDAMVNNRSYRKAKTPEEAQEEVRKCSGTQFDPFLAAEFLHMLEENPELGKGEKTGGDEPRTPEVSEAQAQDSGGTTVPVPYCRYLLDVDDYIIEVDSHFEEVLGYTKYDILNGHMRQIDLIPPEEQTAYIVAVDNQFSKANIAYLEHDILRKDGSKRRIYCMGKRYYDSAVKAFRSEIVIFLTDK